MTIYIPSFDEDKLNFRHQKSWKFNERAELADLLDISVQEIFLEKINRIKTVNEEKYYAQNPDNDWHNFNAPQKSRGPKNIPPEIKIESTKTEPTNDKYKRYISFYLLFLSSSHQGRSNSPRHQVVQPTISSDMTGAYAVSKAGIKLAKCNKDCCCLIELREVNKSIEIITIFHFLLAKQFKLWRTCWAMSALETA